MSYKPTPHEESEPTEEAERYVTPEQSSVISPTVDLLIVLGLTMAVALSLIVIL